MSGHVIHIKGAAWPYDKDTIDTEQVHLLLDMVRLESAGYEITHVGDSEKGFSLEDIGAAFRKNPDVDLVVIDAHGNIENGDHWIQATENLEDANDEKGRLWARDLYQALAHFSGGKPLNIYMSSCGSGNGCKDAIRILPPGSTLINFTEADAVSSYPVKREAFEIVPDTNLSLAENLLLNMLCKGIDHEHWFDGYSRAPQITVSAVDAEIGRTHRLWQTACLECLSYVYDDFPSEAAALIGDKLKKFMPPETLSAALAAIQGYADGCKNTPSDRVIPGAPVTVPYIVDERRFFEQVVVSNLLGPMCAAAYMLHRDEIGAFQIAEPDYYTRPSKVREDPAMAALLKQLAQL